MGNVGGVESPGLVCSRHLKAVCSNYLTTTIFQAQNNQNKCGSSWNGWNMGHLVVLGEGPGGSKLSGAIETAALYQLEESISIFYQST